MNRRKLARKRDACRPAGDRTISEGDIVVTAVAKHYAIGRMTAGTETQEFLESKDDRAEALRRACALARPNRRVFLYPNAGKPAHLTFDCADPSALHGVDAREIAIKSQKVPMSWKCPACSSRIQHHEEVPRPNVVYRCNVCRLELVVDPETGKMTLAPLPEST
jgi:rubredoxin